MDLTLPAHLGISVAVLAAYGVFGLTGFGSAMVAVPVLVQFVLLSYAVPLVLLLDLASTAVAGARNWRQVARGEMLRMLPCMAIGVAIGVLYESQLPGEGAPVADRHLRPAEPRTVRVSLELRF